jgi:hypothetical protein
MTTANGGRPDGPFHRLLRRWRNWRAARAGLDELASSGREAGSIARDVGVSTAELYAIAGASPDSAEQLKQRMNALDLNVVDDAALRDLERTCTLCGAKRRCERDLAQAPDDPVWQSYCPNVQTLQALQDEKKITDK